VVLSNCIKEQRLLRLIEGCPCNEYDIGACGVARGMHGDADSFSASLGPSNMLCNHGGTLAVS